MRFQFRVGALVALMFFVYMLFQQHQRRILTEVQNKRTGLLPSPCTDAPYHLPPPRRYREHRLGVIIPFRDRMQELSELVPNLTAFLNKQDVDHQYFVVNQRDELRFNRGSLLNIGTLVAMAHYCDYVALQDVDLLPLEQELNYRYPENGPYHVSAPGLHPKYKFRKFLGGIVLMRISDMIAANGFSNRFWGWGKEDDDFRRRILDFAKLEIDRPPMLKTGMTKTFRHLHVDRADDGGRDKVRHSGQQAIFNITNPMEGLNTTTYSSICVEQQMVSEHLVNFVNVEFTCNRTDTPWCDYLPADAKPEDVAGGVGVKDEKKGGDVDEEKGEGGNAQ
eukprot:comp63293_c0_seq1/m.47948 comp63293_c0_seq1/g.47948  ORF comp63293_c0_seq1/g.47948 comp63293_c0_seq1/m.47948 type:complete len:335 (-) comp63293_c0_seq1:4-1008(-)